MDPHSRAPKKNTNHGNEVLPQDTTHLIQRPYVTNEEVLAKIQQAIGPHEDLLTIVKRCKLQWYGHFFRSSGLPKNCLARHSERGKNTRHMKRWEDNIREWTGLEFAKSQRAVENRKERKKWRKLVVKSAVVPQRPPRLRARCRKGEFNSCSEISFPSRLSLRELESKGKIITIPPPTSFFLYFGVGYHAVRPIIL